MESQEKRTILKKATINIEVFAQLRRDKFFRRLFIGDKEFNHYNLFLLSLSTDHFDADFSEWRGVVRSLKNFVEV